jgi:hypothetical protein
MAYVADIEYVEDLMDEFDLDPNDKIADLLEVLEDVNGQETSE